MPFFSVVHTFIYTQTRTQTTRNSILLSTSRTMGSTAVSPGFSSLPVSVLASFHFFPCFTSSQQQPGTFSARYCLGCMRAMGGRKTASRGQGPDRNGASLIGLQPFLACLCSWNLDAPWQIRVSFGSFLSGIKGLKRVLCKLKNEFVYLRDLT